uniref:NFACT RNA-binding domain-containing protein n=2 Tax=Rhodosorus marinus TaxID=101924 RepID=A0A7S2ZV77_9RHOD|mmetsp:Transcript_32024/g.124668  ORF Transcript_32024/g.124668 Transcript_32024/m.124668 type:complete len:871 (+) Transcript_32024:547-3159(+)
MMKSRMSALDLEVQVKELRRRIVGSKVVNIYDVTDKVYTIKLNVPPRKKSTEIAATGESPREVRVGDQSAAGEQRPQDGVDEGWQKVLLLIESGIRVHTTLFDREKGDAPSGFTAKMRKHLRNKRLGGIEQVMSDRTINLVFTSSSETCHLVIELYAAGNIILTDSEFKIIALLREFRPKDEAKYSPRVVGAVYPMSAARTKDPLSESSVLDAIETSEGKKELRKVLAHRTLYGIQSAEHALVENQLKLNVLVKDIESSREEVIPKITRSIVEVENRLADNADQDVQSPGYLLLREGLESENGEVAYEDFTPVLLAQYKNRPNILFKTFDEAMDEYFAYREKEKEQTQKQKTENARIKKLEKLKSQLDGRVAELENQELSSKESAMLIEDNVEEIETALTIFRSAVVSGMDWKELDRMLKEEQENDNPVLRIVHSLHLDRNEITVKLTPRSYYDEFDDEGFEAEDDAKPKLVTVNLNMTPRQNAEQYFRMKKTSTQKKMKAEDAGAKALKSAEKKAAGELQKIRATQAIRQKRKPFWFEKFHWFISSQNYLVISGRDAQQNELIVKRYMAGNDVYFHADVHGAASVIVKNKTNATIDSIPHATLIQAGNFAMCRSIAWINRIVTSAWWVRPSQVSKTAPSGQYVTSGSFVIRGKKNFLPPMALEFGLGMLFKIDESCIENHAGERSRTSGGLDTDSSVHSFGDHSPEHLHEVHDTKVDKGVNPVDESGDDGNLEDRYADDAADGESDEVPLRSEKDAERVDPSGVGSNRASSPSHEDSTDSIAVGNKADMSVSEAADLFEKFAQMQEKPEIGIEENANSDSPADTPQRQGNWSIRFLAELRPSYLLTHELINDSHTTKVDSIELQSSDGK